MRLTGNHELLATGHTHYGLLQGAGKRQGREDLAIKLHDRLSGGKFAS